LKNLIKLERARIDLTQAELAEKVNVSRQTINSIEIGKYVPCTVLAFKIAYIFGKPVDEIFLLEKDDW
jgi:putative transcriptional regulator